MFLGGLYTKVLLLPPTNTQPITQIIAREFICVICCACNLEINSGEEHWLQWYVLVSQQGPKPTWNASQIPWPSPPSVHRPRNAENHRCPLSSGKRAKVQRLTCKMSLPCSLSSLLLYFARSVLDHLLSDEKLWGEILTMSEWFWACPNNFAHLFVAFILSMIRVKLISSPTQDLSSWFTLFQIVLMECAGFSWFGPL